MRPGHESGAWRAIGSGRIVRQRDPGQLRRFTRVFRCHEARSPLRMWHLTLPDSSVAVARRAQPPGSHKTRLMSGDATVRGTPIARAQPAHFTSCSVHACVSKGLCSKGWSWTAFVGPANARQGPYLTTAQRTLIL